ncbi:MAG: orotidine-5'-phosphate decarboxylase [Calditrichaeota bacterium]|nr:MAG: orotidine-5'-phosphate decarboxylase [Calditrichota bacterium]
MFNEMLNDKIRNKRTLVCLGLDTDIHKIPGVLLSEIDPLYEFNKAIIASTHEFVAAYKLNIAFYESLGIPGWELLERTLSIIPSDTLTIADAKRADIENTSRKYAETYFKTFNFDAITVSPYMGMDSVAPFLEYEDKGVFVLCLTSNAGAQDFQFLQIEEEPLYLKVAQKVLGWNFLYGNCGLVVGGTHTNEIQEIREMAPELPFLVPGIGAQGGNLEKVVKYATDSFGLSALINVSRSVLYASSEANFAEVARERVKNLRDQINRIINVQKNPGLIDQN